MLRKSYKRKKVFSDKVFSQKSIAMKIWALHSLPSLEEVQPEPALLARAAGIPLTSQTEMQRCPGQRSYCHKIGQGCGGPQHRQAWEEFRTELDHDDLQAMARHFVEDQCRDLTPERRAASAQFVLLLVTTGLELLRGVAVQLHSLEVEQCWAWSARCEPRRPPARPAAQRRPRPQGPQRRAPRRDVLGGVVRQARAQSNPARHDAVGVGAGRLQPGAGRIRLLRPSRRLPGALRARRRTAGAVVQSLSMCSSLLHTPGYSNMLERLTRAGRVPQVCIGCAILATRKRWARRCGRRGSGRGPRRARLQLPRRTRATLRWRSPSRTSTRPQTYSWLWRPTPRPGQPELTGSEGMIRSALAAARTCDPPSRPAWPQAGRVRPLRVRVLAERL